MAWRRDPTLLKAVPGLGYGYLKQQINGVDPLVVHAHCSY